LQPSSACPASKSHEAPPGTYLVTGHSPQIQDGKELCSAAKTVTVTRTGLLKNVHVICQIS
jgi:hypothetical protein